MPEVLLLHLFLLLSCDQCLGKEIHSKLLQWEFTQTLQSRLLIAGYRFLSLLNTMYLSCEKQASLCFLFLGFVWGLVGWFDWLTVF